MESFSVNEPKALAQAVTEAREAEHAVAQARSKRRTAHYRKRDAEARVLHLVRLGAMPNRDEVEAVPKCIEAQKQARDEVYCAESNRDRALIHLARSYLLSLNY